MSYSSVPLNRNAIEDLLRESAITRIVTLVNLSSQSILELLEYGMSRQDINMALARGVVAFDKSPSMAVPPNDKWSALEKAGDYYFMFLSSKVRLTELGIYILETIEQNQVPLVPVDGPSLLRSDQGFDGFGMPNQAPSAMAASISLSFEWWQIISAGYS